MRPLWLTLNERDQDAFRAAIAFLDSRLEDRKTIDWALHLKENETVKRLALSELISGINEKKINEPWRSAWKLITESWDSSSAEEDYEIYDVKRRLITGERSGALIDAIVEIVKPRLELKSFSSAKNPKKIPKKIDDLLSGGLYGGSIISPTELNLESVAEKQFLMSLATSLDLVIINRLELARRVGWDGEYFYWKIGTLNRAYYVTETLRNEGDDEPDSFSHGIAPLVKLLYSVISRLADIDISVAVDFAARWRMTDCQIHLRLWAALSRDPRITPPNEIATFLLSLNDRHFWSLHNYPEIAELRAVRFKDLIFKDQAAIIKRIRKRPPRSHWPKDVETTRIDTGRLYWAIRELRRIEIAGGVLPSNTQNWLTENIIKFPELVQMTRIDEGFSASPRATSIPQEIDNRYDLLVGEERLKALESALTSSRGWNDNQSGGAVNWIQQPINTIKLLDDLESVPTRGTSYVNVWEKFGWAHSPSAQSVDDTPRDLTSEASRALSLISKLSDEVVQNAIDGLTYWLSTWSKQVAALPNGLEIWIKLWPFAATATNSQQPDEEEPHLSVIARSSNDQEPMDLDTLNTPVGRLVGAFLYSCPNLDENKHPFDQEGSALRIIRDIIFSSSGRSLLIARHRLIENLSYFLHADPSWTRNHLITPLNSDSIEALAFWRAIARRTQFFNVLKIIGDTMVDRATDLRLGRETRRSLVFSLVIECLHALNKNRDPVVQKPKIMQMIRSLDDELRAYGAEAVQRFVRDLSKLDRGESIPPSPEQLFKSAAKPFLEQFWPQEYSLTTPGVSKAFADLPMASGESFSAAVSVIERFLVPFDCWSMMDYGLYGAEDKLNLEKINNLDKAKAFLRLLDLTVGTSDGAVIPYDLGDALDQIRTVSPALSEDRAFRRLAAAARR